MYMHKDCKCGRTELIWIAINDHIYQFCFKLINSFYGIIPKEMPIQLYWHFPCQPENLISYVQNCFVCVIQFWSARVALYIVSLKSNSLLRTQPFVDSSSLSLSFREGPGAIKSLFFVKSSLLSITSFSYFNALEDINV